VPSKYAGGIDVTIRFASQSISAKNNILVSRTESALSGFPSSMRTTADWLAYFRANAARVRPIPWEKGADVTPMQLNTIACSLQAWQLGETSDGRHLRAAAARYAAQVGDAHYPAVVDLFIREEQRHGAMLGRFLDLAGVGRITSNWGDSLFRAF